jgi:hypothetical protein
MKYMITIYNNASANAAIDGEAAEEFERTHREIGEELNASGELVASNELSVPGAKVVRVNEGTTTVTDGPFSEGKETTGGYYLVDCATMDRAIEIASRFVEARYAPVEVRALMHS